MNTTARLPRLGDQGPCPHCRDRQGWLSRRGAGSEPACPVCGRRPRVCRLLYVSNFFEQRKRQGGGPQKEM
jgi:hypothetical protein